MEIEGKKWGFAGRNLHVEILKEQIFPEATLPSIPFTGLASFLPICIQDCRCSSARQLPLFSFTPRFLAFFFIYLAHPLSPLLPLACEKCPKVSNNVTRISKLGSILETLFIFFFFFSFLSFFFDPNISSTNTRYSSNGL